MNEQQAKLNLFKGLRNVFPQPDAKKDFERVATWSISYFFARNREEKKLLGHIPLVKLAKEYREWIRNQ